MVVLYPFAVTYRQKSGEVILEPCSADIANKLFKNEISPAYSIETLGESGPYTVDGNGLFTAEVILFYKPTPTSDLSIFSRKPIVSKEDIIMISPSPSSMGCSHHDPRDALALGFELPGYTHFPNMVVIKGANYRRLAERKSNISCKVIKPKKPTNENAPGYVIMATINGGCKNYHYFDNVYIGNKQQENYLCTGKEIFFGELGFVENGSKPYVRQFCSIRELALDDLTKAFHSISKARKIMLLDRKGNAGNIDIYQLDKQGVERIFSGENKNLIKLKLENFLAPSTNPIDLPVVVINKQKTELSDIVHDLGHPVFKLG